MTAHVIVDHSAAFNQGAGIGRYARNLVPELISSMPEARFALWYAPEPGAGARFADQALEAIGDSARVRSTRVNRRRMDQIWFRARVPIPIELWTGRGDLVYSPDFTAPPAIRTPRVITVHDLAFEIVPERAPIELRQYLSAVVPRQAREAAAVIAVSETTKRDIAERLGIAPERVTVIPNAADERFFAAGPLTPGQRVDVGLPERYYLIVGTIEPRKNHPTLFKAIRQLPERARLPLVVVGRTGWSADEIVREAKTLAADGRVILLDYVEERWLPGLYAGAEALIYPSWYEGFGLPVLEGLAAGTRVIASDVPAHREIAGDLATFVSPASADELVEAMVAIVETADDPVARKSRQNQARGYSWQGSGADLAALLREVIGS